MKQLLKYSSLVAFTLSLLTGCGSPAQRSTYSGPVVTTTSSSIPYSPPTTPLAGLACRVTSDVSVVAPGRTVNFKVTASGGPLGTNYTFGRLWVDFGSSVPLTKSTNVLTPNIATAANVFSTQGQKFIRAEISNDQGEQATCDATLSVQSQVLAFSGDKIADLGGAITLVPQVYGFEPNKTIYYSYSVLENNVNNPLIQISGGSSGIVIRALDQLKHANVTVSVFAFTDPSNYVQTSVQVAFLPQLRCRLVVTGTKTVNNPVTFKAEAWDPMTGMATTERLSFVSISEVPDVTVTSGLYTSQAILNFAKAGRYLPSFQVQSLDRSNGSNVVYCQSATGTYLTTTIDIN